MNELNARVSTLLKLTYLRIVIVFVISVLLYILNLSLLWAIVLFVANGCLSKNEESAVLSGAIAGFATHLAIIFYNKAISQQGGYIDVLYLFMPILGALAGITLSGIAYALKKRNAGWLLLVGILVGLPMWLSSYHQYTNSTVPLLSSLLLLAVISGVTTAKFSLGRRTIVFVLMTSFLMALIIKLYLDSLEDPTSHNLAPFEVGFNLLCALGFTLIGVALGMSWQRFVSRRAQNNQDL